MERIRIAVEKARQQSAEQELQSGNEALKAPRPVEEDFAKIHYSQTKVVELDLDHLERHRIVAYNKNHPSSWMFDILRTRVLHLMEENGWRTWPSHHPAPRLARRLLAINLAMSMAHQTQHTAMLVDFDLRRPKVGTYLGIKREKSLNDVLAGTAEISDAMINPNLPSLVVLPTNKPVKNQPKCFHQSLRDRIITELRGRYQERIVIFDLPPLWLPTMQFPMLPKIDCVLVVIGNGMSTQREIKESLRHLSGANLLGMVMNKAELRTKNSYY